MNIKVNEIELHYEKTGTGKPLLLLHGNGEDHHIFDQLAAKLQQHFTVYAIDSRNHGASQVTTDYAYDTMMADICSFIEELQLAPVDMIGFSDGAIIALLLAMNHPKQMHKMALLGANLSPQNFKEDCFEYLVETYKTTGDPLIKLMMEQPDIKLNELAGITVPALVIAGEDDIFKADTFTIITETLPDARMLIMPGHDHASYITNQDILYPDLIEFFTEA